MEKRITFDRFVKEIIARRRQGDITKGKLEEDNNNYDALKCAMKAVSLFRVSGNLEHLVDAAVYLGLECNCPLHPNAHYKTLDFKNMRWPK
jgi:hypothetical protein